jgi:hypothetical protein
MRHAKVDVELEKAATQIANAMWAHKRHANSR